MVERLKLEPEVQEIFKCIDSGQNFLLSGGAGSGKTYSLVQVIKQAIEENPTAKVACMTYTNAAVKEIEDRVNHANLKVSTIHDFLWDNIKHFQKELKSALVTLINDEEVKKIKIDLNPIQNDFFNHCVDGIQYQEYLKLKEGIISHDELLIVANYLFREHPKLSDILKDRYKFIFIDEYQDTNKAVVEIFLNHLRNSKKKNTIGFFGDAMQSIYDDGIGNLDEYKGDELEKVKEIKKQQNRRNPKKIIYLANKLRTDGITQKQSDDDMAPNMVDGKLKEGNIKFIYSDNHDVNEVRKFLSNNYIGWNFSNSKETKELNLTHNLIADKAKFRTLMDIYDKDRIIELKDKLVSKIKEGNLQISEDATFGDVINQVNLARKPGNVIDAFISQNPDLYLEAKSYPFSVFKKMYVSKDQLLDDKKQTQDDENKKGSKRDNLIKHLFKIQHTISLYQEKRYNEFLRLVNFKISKIDDKIALKNSIYLLTDVGDKTIEEIINDADKVGISLIDDKIERFRLEKEYLYNRVKKVKFREFQELYKYLEGHTPFSTKHKTKGNEFNNVLVILDNGNWNNYNFENLFLKTLANTALERTQKIFYMCCTRAKENLAIFYHLPKSEVVAKAKILFGDENVIKL